MRISDWSSDVCSSDLSGLWLFPGRRGQPMTTRQYARLLDHWLKGIGLEPALFGTHSLRRTKANLISRRTGNLRAVQLLLGHSKIESTFRYFGVEVDDAPAIADRVDVYFLGQTGHELPPSPSPPP